MNFENKRVLVTGGAQGLGRAICEKFIENGARVFALDKDGVLLQELESTNPGIKTIHVDLLNWEATKSALEPHLPFDCLVNNAGILKIESVLKVAEEDIDLVFGVNFKAALNVTQIFARSVISHGVKGATIVNTSSLVDQKVMFGGTAYCSSKAALTMLTKCTAKELGMHGIRVNCIRPGLMNTNILEEYKSKDPNYEENCRKEISKCPVPRVLETKEAADLVLFLSSPLSAMITGEDIAIDGGWHLV